MLGKIVAILAILGALSGAALWFDNHYAKCADVKANEVTIRALAVRLDNKIESDNLAAKQSRLWALEDRYGADIDKVSNPEIKAQMRELQLELNKGRVKP